MIQSKFIRRSKILNQRNNMKSYCNVRFDTVVGEEESGSLVRKKFKRFGLVRKNESR